MGVDALARLIVGWEVDPQKTGDFLKKYNVVTCDGGCDYKYYGPCCANPSKWIGREELPLQSEFTFVRCLPAFYKGDDDIHVYLTLKNGETNVTQFATLLKEVDWDQAQRVAVELGSCNEPARVYAVMDDY